MEKFKSCERESKTKAFSTAALSKAGQLEGRDKDKYECREWLNESVDRLNEQIEQFEAEQEELTANATPAKKGRGKTPEQEKLERVEESMRRHRDHIGRLEQIMRALDNEAIELEDVQEIRELVEDYMERNQEDFDQFASTDDIYEPLLDKLDTTVPVPAAAASGPKAAGSKKEESAAAAAEREAEKQRERERAAALAAKAQLQAQLGRVEESTRSSTPSVVPPPPTLPTPASAGTPAANSSPGTPGRQNSQGVLQPAPETSKTAAAVVAGRAAAPAPSGPVPAASPQPAPGFLPAGPLAAAAPVDLAFAAAAAGKLRQAPTPPPGMGPVAPQAAAKPAVPPGMAPLALVPPSGPVKGPGGILPSPTGADAAGQDLLLQQLAGMQLQGQADFASSLPPEVLANMEVVEPSAADLGPLAEFRDPAKSSLQYFTTSDVSKALQGSYLQGRGVPMSGDAEVPWGSMAKRRLPIFPGSYPTVRHPSVDSPQLYKKLEEQVALEVSFFSFYMQPGTLQQFMAAQYLRSKSWRYHRLYRAWFLRQSEPQLATDTYERGNYVYFDFNFPAVPGADGWTYRFKMVSPLCALSAAPSFLLPYRRHRFPPAGPYDRLLVPIRRGGLLAPLPTWRP